MAHEKTLRERRQFAIDSFVEDLGFTFKHESDSIRSGLEQLTVCELEVIANQLRSRVADFRCLIDDLKERLERTQ